jgi:hypothetical protein
VGDSGAVEGKSVGVEPFGWLDSGSTGVGAGSGACAGADVSATGSLGVF